MGSNDILPIGVMVGSRVPSRVAHQIGIFVVHFSSLESELKNLIRHVARVGEGAGRAVVGAVASREARALLLEELAIANVKNRKDRDKLLRLAREFRRVAEYRQALLSHEFLGFMPPGDTVAAHLKELEARPPPVELSLAWIFYNTNLTCNLAARMHQYRMGDPIWRDDTHFPWHEEPMIDPDTVPHLTRRPKQH